jgi:hypothetical protein
VYQSVRALGFEPVLYLYYRYSDNKGMIVDKVIDLEYSIEEEGDDVFGMVFRNGGIFVAQGCAEALSDSGYGMPERLEWVTPMTEFNCQKQAYAAHRNDFSLSWGYGHVCLVVRIGKVGERLAYPTVAELEKAHQEREEEGLYRSSYW